MLEVDHIQPSSKGGSGDINNLVTSCFDCNRGKRDIVLSTVPNSVKQNLKILKEKELQFSEYYDFAQKIEKRIQREILAVSAIYAKEFPGWVFNESFQQASIKNFLQHLPSTVVEEAMWQSCQRMKACHHDEESARGEAIRYFCGYCWKLIKGFGTGRP